MTDFNPAPVNPLCTLADLDRLDLRVGTILAVAEVPGSDKLMALRVSFGNEERTILAGLKKERAEPKEIEGRQALFLLNLEPRKMMGLVSQGLLVDVGFADGLTPCLLVTEKPLPNGARAG